MVLNKFEYLVSMRIFYLLIVISILFSGCNKRKTNLVLVNLKQPLAEIIDSFTQTYSGRNIYELYINKLDVDEFTLYLFAGDGPLIANENEENNQQPIIYTLSNDEIIYIYSGVERFFNYGDIKDSTFFASSLKSLEDGVYWVIKDEEGILSIEKHYYAFYPYWVIFHNACLPAPVILDLEENE